PVESLMPLRLAKYGVPLAETAPAGLAAAGIEPPPELVPVPRAPELVATEQTHAQPEIAWPPAEHTRATETPQSTTPMGQSPTGSFNAFEPTLRRSLALAPERRTVTAVIDSGRPAPRGEQEGEQRNGPGPGSVNLTKTTEAEGFREQADAEPAPATAPAPAAVAMPESNSQPAAEPAPEVTAEPAPAADLAREPTPGPDANPVEPLTTVDRYYLAWTQYIQQYAHEPRDTALSQHLAENGMTGRGGAPVSPSTLRRYLPHFRIYAAWSQHLDQGGGTPTPDQLFSALAGQGITGAPYTPEKVAPPARRLPPPPCRPGRARIEPNPPLRPRSSCLAVIGGAVGYGQCLVCAYTRSPDAAEEEAAAEHYAQIMGE
ncbi:hypothetical protein ACIRD4_35795, partial [Streptomyces clavifer]